MSITQIIREYEEAKREYQHTCETLKAKAIELGLEPKVADDVRMSLAYITAHRNAIAKSGVLAVVEDAILDLQKNKHSDAFNRMKTFCDSYRSAK